jgi:hypothetical protein
MIASIGYLARSRMLEIEFVSGTIYRYFDVEQETFGDFLEAPRRARSSTRISRTSIRSSALHSEPGQPVARESST